MTKRQTIEDAIEVVNREFKKLFANQVSYDDSQGHPTWTVSGATEDENELDRLDYAVSVVTPHLTDWLLYRPDGKRNVYHLYEIEKPAGLV